VPIVVDLPTGEIQPAYIHVAVLRASNCTYAEAAMTLKGESMGKVEQQP